MKKILIGVLGIVVSTSVFAATGNSYLINASDKDISVTYQICSMNGNGPEAVCQSPNTIKLLRKGSKQNYQMITVKPTEYVQVLSGMALTGSEILTQYEKGACASAIYAQNADPDLGSLILNDYDVPNKLFCGWNAI